ncbi:MAG: DNA repair exonuclease [Hoeflea sp.]|uniref:metallophosphoesterase family protein n=1 Tax=Hoeflea sp. TaxID=1940281 RepID=UPI00272FE055|nr:DNA repair exonuclease [Hoeflea sp.]MDP2122507.1 DNA repair exonuclease [Hoeflea sp.]MDP3525438.1 DNA repair exonuclease [Hoeflea sp.]
MPVLWLRARSPEELPIAAYRFVHTADIHLDSPLRSLALRNPELAELIGAATRKAFAATIDLCLDERVDALLIAGDLYDGDQTSMKTARFLAGELGRLASAGIATFIIRGNHDALSRISKELVLPDRVRLFGGRAEHVLIDRAAGEKPVAIHGLSFAQATAPESLLSKYRQALPDTINIGMMHTSLGGAEGHDVYAPCSPADLVATGFDYWALGHIHKRSVIHNRGAIVMPGMPQGRDINEDGPKSVTLVSIADDGTVSLEERPTSLAEFARVSVDAGGLTEWSELAEAIRQALGQARDTSTSPELVVRLGFTGATPLAWRMRRDADVLLTEAEERAARIGSTWIEKFEIGATPLRAEGGSATDPLHELRALIDSAILGSDGYDAALGTLASGLRAQLPADLRDLFGADEAAANLALSRLAREGAQDVLARLQSGSGSGSETA